MRAFTLFIPSVLIVSLLAACSSAGQSDLPEDASTVAGTPTYPPVPPGVGGDPVRYGPAVSDGYGEWVTAEIHGVSVEFPLNARWEAEIILDPCFGDERYYIVLEDIVTRDRVKIDMVERRVASEARNPDDLNALTERIIRSIKGAHRSAYVEANGPLPTMVWCEPGDVDAVPTRSPGQQPGPRPTPPAVDGDGPGQTPVIPPAVNDATE